MSVYCCLVVDDEALARELIATHLSQFPQFALIGSCASAIEAIEIMKNHQVDLIFLDIEMPVLKGTDFYKSLVHKPEVIFTTAYRDYAVEGFDLDAVDYLLKPIFFARFFNAIDKFLALKKPLKVESDQPDNNQSLGGTARQCSVDGLFVRKDRKQIKIKFIDVLYISGLKDYIEVHLSNGSHVIKSTLVAFEKKLPQQFLRVHRSYIINKQKITAYTQHDVEIGQIEIPIGESYKNDFKRRLMVS